jgi:hypothetical protein
MISLMKVIAALLLGISVAALPANGHPPDDDSLLSLNDTLPANESLPLRDQPKREDWRSAQIWCYFEMKAFWYDFRIYGEGFLGREENLERKVMTAADRAGKVTGWKVAHYPPEGDKNSSAIIKVSPPVPYVIASRWCSYYCLSLVTDISLFKFSLPILTADKLERKLGEIFHKKFDCQQTDL